MSLITVIGGITVDIEGVPYEPLIYKDSNPGTVKFSFGGVGKNIAENLARMGLSTRLISAIGNDTYGKDAVNYCNEIGIETKHIGVFKDVSTAVYMSILDENRDMVMAICNMDTFSKITYQYILDVSNDIEQSEVVVLDTNMSEKMMADITDLFQHKTLVLDPVSANKAIKAKNLIGKFDIIKPNRLEAEILTGLNLDTADQIRRAGGIFIEKGVKEVFITLGVAGVYYENIAGDWGIIHMPKLDIASATGAGDAFTAGIIYGFLKGQGIKQSAYYGCASAAIAIEHERTVNPNMSNDLLKEKVKGLFIEA